ncbi:MAG: hypothetical protein WBN51_07635, partial [Gammaproteobacteria bacterium]
MVQPPAISATGTRDELVVTPFGDYELIDFGAGSKLERWGEYTVERPDRLARGKAASDNWQADWIYV